MHIHTHTHAMTKPKEQLQYLVVPVGSGEQQLGATMNKVHTKKK